MEPNRDLIGSKVGRNPSYLETTTFPELDEAPELDVDEVSQSPLRFSVSTLLLATTFCGCTVALLKALSLIGLVILFALAVLVDLTLRAREHPARHTLACCCWGIVMPGLCILFDPGFFHQPWQWNRWLERDAMSWFRSILHDPRAVICLPAILLQCAGMSLWLLTRHRWGTRYGDFAGGFFFVGASLASLIGLTLLPFTILGSFFLVGIVGFTPFCTAMAYSRVAHEATLMADRGRSEWATKWLGACVAIALPLVISLAVAFASSGK